MGSPCKVRVRFFNYIMFPLPNQSATTTLSTQFDIYELHLLAVFILETHNPSRRIMRLLCYPSGVKTGRTI